MLESILAGDFHFYEVFLSELLRNDLVNVVLPLGGVEPHPEPHDIHVSRDVVQSNCGKFLGFLMMVLTKDTAMLVLHLGFISEPKHLLRLLDDLNSTFGPTADRHPDIPLSWCPLPM